MMDCESLQIVAGNTLTPLPFVLMQSGQPIDLAGSEVKAKLLDEDGVVVVELTEDGITIQPQRSIAAIDSKGSIRINGHQLQNGYQVRLTTAGTLPSGLAIDTPYFVRDVTPNEFRLAAKPGSAAIVPTGGSGTHSITPLGVVYWELPSNVEAGSYRVWLQRIAGGKTDDFGHPRGIVLEVRANS